MIARLIYFLQETPAALPGLSDSTSNNTQSLWDLVWGWTPGENGEDGHYSMTSVIVVSLLLFLSVMAIYLSLIHI